MLNRSSAVRRRRALALLALLVAPAWLHADTASLPILVSIAPQQFLVEQVAGDRARIDVLVAPGHGPATYEPTPQQMRRVREARAWFRIGVAFEAVWHDRLVAAGPSMRVVDMAAGIARRQADRVEGARAGGLPDPHVWTSPRLARRMAGTVRDALVELDPAHAAHYRANHDRLATELDALDARLREMLAPVRGRSFLVFHPSWGYFADEYGLTQLPIESAGKDPGPRTLTRVIAEAKRRGIRVVFVQEQFSRAMAEQVAREIDGKVVAVDPLSADYVANLLAVGGALAASAR